MKQVRLLMAGLFLMVSSALFAQRITVNGTVIDASTNEPVPYASIQIKGTTSGVSSDDFGKFSIDVDAQGTLIFSSIGYVTKEVAVAGQAQMVVNLDPDAIMLEETIVVGYGSAKKISSVVGSASTVRAKALENRPVANAADALQGQVSGLQVFSSTGEPSANVSMRIRGVNSINSGTTPLIILDGAPVDISVFTALSGNDIESINVLKDASSTAIYGSRAANGVIYVTTKKGKRGERAQVQIRGQYGFSELAKNRYNLMNSEEWWEVNETHIPNFAAPGSEMAAYKEFALKHNINTDWTDYLFKNYTDAPVWGVEASISGATDNTDYYISVNQFDQTGSAPKSYLERYGIRTNINTKVNNWLKFGLNLGLTYQNTSSGMLTSGSSNMNNVYNPVNAANWYLPWASPYDYSEGPNGELINNGVRSIITEMGADVWNPMTIYEAQNSTNNYFRVNGNMYEEITPIKGLVLRAAQALDGLDYRATYEADPYENGPFDGNAMVQEVFQRYMSMTFTNTIEYKFSPARNHNITVLVGQEAILSSENVFGASVEGITDGRFNTIADGTSGHQLSWSGGETVFNSYFARASYDFNDKYFIDASYRIDGSSLFGKNNRYAQFYSVGLMWSIKNENFMRNVYWVNDLRFKASYGTTGNSSISNYLSYGTVGANGYYNSQLGWGVGNPENDDLTWEKVASLNIGISARLFDRLSVNVEFYNKNTTDMLMEIPYSLTTGVASAWGNVGSMRNTGVDFDFNVDIVRTSDFYFGIGANFNYNRNIITSLFEGRDEFIVTGTGLKYEVGKPLGEIYYPINAGVDSRDGRTMWYDLDGNLTKLYSDNLAQFTGFQRYAPWAGGVQLNFQWKGLSVGADFSWIAGKYTINNDMFFLMNPSNLRVHNGSADLLDMWQQPGDVTNVARYDEEVRFDTRFVENASFFRLKNLQVSYTFPSELIQKSKFLQGLRIYAVARNLFTITPYRGYDPEVDSNLQMGVYPSSRQYTFGIELTF